MIVLVDVVGSFVRREGRLQAFDGDSLRSDSWHGDLVGVAFSRNDAVRADVRRSEARLYSSSANENVSRRLEFRRNVDVWRSMGRRIDRLKACDFETQFVESCGSL